MELGLMPVTRHSTVVLVARVDDPVVKTTEGTWSTVVGVEHYDDDPLPTVVEMAMEIAPPVTEWSRY